MKLMSIFAALVASSLALTALATPSIRVERNPQVAQLAQAARVPSAPVAKPAANSLVTTPKTGAPATTRGKPRAAKVASGVVQKAQAKRLHRHGLAAQKAQGHRRHHRHGHRHHHHFHR